MVCFELLKPLLQTDASYPEHPGYLANPASERHANDRKSISTFSIVYCPVGALSKRENVEKHNVFFGTTQRSTS